MQCAPYKDRAVQWQAFLLAMTGQQAASLHLDDPTPGPMAGLSRDAVLARAKAGGYREIGRAHV